MKKSRENFADRCYRALLRVLPYDFRMEFEGEMQEVFREQREDIKRSSGTASLFRMWWATILDIFRMAPREHWSVISQDARYAGRMMRKNVGFTFAAIVILGLGIGANTAIFSVVSSVLLKPLPYIDGDRLVILRQPETKLGTEDAFFSVQEIQDLRQQSSSLTNVVEYHNMTFTLFAKGIAHRVRTGVVSADFFEVFGVRPLLGRTFVAADENHAADPVLILSYEFWREAEGGDPNIIGKRYEMNDRTHVVIGVLPPIPQYPDENDVYMPTSSCPMRSDSSHMAPRDARMMNVFGRLKSDADLENSRAEIVTLSKQMHKDHPAAYPKNAGIATTVSLLRDDLTKNAKPLLLLLWGAAGFVLLISCANVANLIMARMSRRKHELMIRTAVGAGSGRLLRQLLTESFFLTVLACMLGLFFAYGSLELMKNFAGGLTPRAREIAIDFRVLGFAVFCATLTTFIFGSVAALQSRQDVASGLKEGGRTGSEGGSNWIRRFLITAQFAFSCVLLIGAGLMVRSFVQLMKVNPGFTPQRAIAVRTDYNGDKFATAEKRFAVATQIQQKLASIPGVDYAAVSSSFPLDRENLVGGRPIRFQVEGDFRPESELPPVTTARSATADYFKVLQIPLLSGRTFRDSDHATATPVVILNRAVAAKRFGTIDPVGKRITIDNGESWMTIIGVVGDVKEFGLGQETPYQIYRPMAQRPIPVSVLVRTGLDPDGMSEQIRRALREVMPEMAIVRIETMEQARANSVASPRMLANLFSLFAALALVIAIAGIGSMLALWVRQRVRETGIRMALGATPGNILSNVLQQGMTLVIVGLVLGLLCAMVVTRSLNSLLFQVKSTDLATYAFVSVILLVAAFFACCIPARRASRIDPQTALRCE
ncbi:ABC transporter permease [bacterium]|nr:ABC transporter permease [bacterium]